MVRNNRLKALGAAIGLSLLSVACQIEDSTGADQDELSSEELKVVHGFSGKNQIKGVQPLRGDEPSRGGVSPRGRSAPSLSAQAQFEDTGEVADGPPNSGSDKGEPDPDPYNPNEPDPDPY